MGLTRKLMSASSLGAVDFRSDKERVARSARLSSKALKEQNRLLKRQELERRLAEVKGQRVAQGPPPGWLEDAADPSLLRWWDGTQWTEHRQPKGPPPEMV